MVINTMGFIDGAGYDLLLHSIQALKADVVLVLGQDRLFSQLQSALRVSHDKQGLCQNTARSRIQILGGAAAFSRGCAGDCRLHSALR